MFSSQNSQVSNDANYIEDVFSTYLYTGTGANLTINNGIDLAGKGGLTWFKSRSGAYSNALLDTARGTNKALFSNSTAANSTFSYLTSFNSNGVTFPGGFSVNNNSGATYALWTFRKQPKFFDVVTYTGTGSARTVAHNLGSVPGCIIVKQTSGADPWFVYHQSRGNGEAGQLNSTAAFGADSVWNYTDPTATGFTVNSSTNTSGATFVAYLFAHNAGGFGLTGTDNVISCGSYTGSSSSDTVVNLGYEPQFVMIKKTNGSDNWLMFDSMRGLTVKGQKDAYLWANSSNYENQQWGASDYLYPTATGFALEAGYGEVNADGFNYIYIAIRRGPMKVPTSGTSVFYPLARTGNNTQTNLTGFGFPPDLAWTNRRDGAEGFTSDKLRGPTKYLTSQTTAAEGTYSSGLITLNQDGVTIGTSNEWNAGTPIANWFFRRAPSFFDEVCYTGTGSARTVTHNLGVAPELMIVKARVTVGGSDRAWTVYSANLNNTSFLRLNQVDGAFTGNTTCWNSTSPTSSVFTVGTANEVNGSGATYVAYLFATCAGVSKCTAFTGTGTLQTINCGFTSGARFVLIKRTDSTGDWYVWDSSRGLSSSTDPYLLLNSTAAEVTSTNWVDTTSTGFQVTAASGNNVNINGASYIALAIA